MLRDLDDEEVSVSQQVLAKVLSNAALATTRKILRNKHFHKNLQFHRFIYMSINTNTTVKFTY